MLNLEFATREMTAREMHLLIRSTKETDIPSEIEFVAARAESVDDPETLMRLLYARPVSELRFLFSTALEAAMPATLAAMKVVTEQFPPKDYSTLLPPAQPDLAIEEMFRDDVLGGG